ncbi:MAG TPA: hypothetical protein VF755_09055, partial [Catenuloplanes sp.]
AGPQVTFQVEVPSAGTYRLYLDFQHAGRVRTVEFTAVAGQPVTAPAQPKPLEPTPTSSAGHGETDHTHG